MEALKPGGVAGFERSGTTPTNAVRVGGARVGGRAPTQKAPSPCGGGALREHPRITSLRRPRDQSEATARIEQSNDMPNAKMRIRCCSSPLCRATAGGWWSIKRARKVRCFGVARRERPPPRPPPPAQPRRESPPPSLESAGNPGRCATPLFRSTVQAAQHRSARSCTRSAQCTN